MKKSYSKPQIVFESFTLSTDIASGCNLTNVNQASASAGCGLWVDDFDVLFNMGTGSACSVGPDDGQNNTICYHNPDDYAKVIFVS